MGKREVRIVLVPKWMTATLLVLVSAAMIALVAALSGRAYASTLSLRALLANALLFMPWGFLTFMVLDRSTRPRSRTYLLTLIGSAIFAAAVALWQSFLPTRVMTYADSVANVAGAFTGALVAHLRKRVRMRFEY